MRKHSLELFILLAGSLYSFKAGEYVRNEVKNDPPFISIPTPWADSVIKTLNDEEKIAQLFMVAAYSNRDENHINELSGLIEKYGIGGLIFFQGGPLRQANMCNTLQNKSKLPLLIGMDAEWGMAMRLDSTVKYPWQMTLGSIPDDGLIYEMGRQIGEQMNRLGVQVNFAPVVDININPENPVINARSFGENRENVANKGIAYMKGLQSKKVLASAKHFPGHGDTDKDSHKTLPIIGHKYDRLDSVEIYPFRKLIEQGTGSVMVAHLYIPELVKDKNLASTLSPEIVTGLLRDTLNFQGLIFTDALNMKGVSSFYKAGEVDLKALMAGNDVLLFSENVPEAINQIKQAVKDGKISIKEIESRCLKILRAKEWSLLHKKRNVVLENLYSDLNKPEYQLLNRKLFTSSQTLLQNKNDLLPLKSLDTLKIALIAMGDGEYESFHHFLSLYSGIDVFHLPFNPTVEEQNEIFEKIGPYNLIITGIHTQNTNPYSKFKLEGTSAEFLEGLQQRKKVILAAFCNPYALNLLKGLDTYQAIIMAYQNNEYSNEMAAKAIFGGIPVMGKLPVSINSVFNAGSGLKLDEIIRLNYVWPEEVDINRTWLSEIDSIVADAMCWQAFPGCQVLAAKNGKIFYNRTFGYHTYDSTKQVKVSDVYDLASITKIAATLLGIMQLNEDGLIDLDYALCDYLPDLVDTSEYINLTLREILAHQAGLTPWIAFYKNSMYKGKLRYDVYSLDSSAIYNRKVADNLYINHHYEDSIFKQILNTPLELQGEYKYSDIGYYFLKEIIERKTNQPLDKFVKDNYHKKLGMNRTSYYPRMIFSPDEIIPTEDDKTFRNQLIHGYVHDPGAAMLGGAGGHAGLFSNANDLAKLMQMYVSGGSYGGKRYFNESTIKEYTSCQFCENENRRGIGFDKPLPDGQEGGPSCSCVSYMSFGHSGFTGTYAWADPEDQIIYIFLSNRINPDVENKKLISLGIRTRIQEVIYDAVAKSRSSAMLTDSLIRKE